MEITMNQKWTVDVPVVFTKKELIDIVSGAIETGIDHWAAISVVFACGTPVNEGRGVDDFYSEWLPKQMIEGKGIVILDREDDSEGGVLTLPKLLNGIKLHHINNPRADKEMYDAEDYDCIIQYALFKDVVYG